MGTWWQDSVIYQVLVPSYQDSNTDGWGDLPGVTRQLDYLAWLGVRAVWLSPIFRSPMREMGYDVSDYRDVDPRFGTLDDLDALVATAHERGLKVIVDWVPNHTAIDHAWFAESRSARDHPRRDWYIWRDGRPDGSPPTNWISVFGGSVWEKDERTGQYYCHTFLPEQPDLNIRNPEVREALADAMRFWLGRGIDGFRLDALSLLVKDDQFRDNPPNPDYDPAVHAPDEALLPQYTRHQPFVHEVTAEWRRVADGFGDRVLLGELYLPSEEVIAFYGSREHPELHLPLNMQLAWQPWDADRLGSAIAQYASLLPDDAWPAWPLSTHDYLRVAARASAAQARVAALLLCTVRGTPILYYGEEIGMAGVPIDAAQARDPQGRRIGRNRDPERTPMQWNAEPGAGFTTAQPWLPIGADAATANVAVQAGDPHSLLALYRRLIDLRQHDSALAHGAMTVNSHAAPLIGYWREIPDRRLLIVLNLSSDPQTYDLPGVAAGHVLLNTRLDREGEHIDGTIRLEGDEGVIVEC
jgi:alpha-glucosidase